MSSYFHKGYEHRNGSYGRRRHNSVGFRRRRKGKSIGKVVAAVLCVILAAVLIYFFIRYIGPFIDTAFNANKETPDSASVSTADTPTGSYDRVDSKIYVSQGSGYLMFNGIDKTAINYAAVINSIASSADEDINVYSMVIPTNTDIGLSTALRGDSNSQKENLNLISSRMMDRVKSIDVYDILNEHKDEYIYFRTEDSWTSLGAYYAFRDGFAAQTDFPKEKVYSEDDMAQYRGIIKNFAGSYIDRTTDKALQPDGNAQLRENTDTVEFYKLNADYSCYEYTNESYYSDKSDTDTDDNDYYSSEADSDSTRLFSITGVDEDTMSIFPGYKTPLLQIENHDEWDSPERLLIVKDHYANPMVGYFVPGYNQVHVADAMLFKGNLNEYITENDITQVLFLSSVTNANNSLYCQRLRDLFDGSITG